MSKSLSKNHHGTTQNWCFVDAVSLSPPFRASSLGDMMRIHSQQFLNLHGKWTDFPLFGRNLGCQGEQKFDTKWCRWCKIAFIDGKFLPDFHTNQSRHRSQPPSRHRQVLHPRIPRWLGPNLIQLAEIWIFGGNIFFGKKMRILVQVPAFWVRNKNFWEKKTWKPISQLLQSDQNLIPQTEVTSFSPEKVTKMGTETRSLWRYLGMRVALPQ